MDPPRIELGTRQCDCRGIPLTYGPFSKKQFTLNEVKSGPEGDRTPDLYHAMIALCQLSYGPEMKPFRALARNKVLHQQVLILPYLTPKIKFG